MIVQPYDYFLIVWFILAALSTAYVGIDAETVRSLAARATAFLKPEEYQATRP